MAVWLCEFESRLRHHLNQNLLISVGFFICKDLDSICYTPTYIQSQVELTMRSQSNLIPSDLIRNPHSFCFRIKVPKDLQKMVGKKELRYSLKTGIVEIANQKSQFLAVRNVLVINKTVHKALGE